MGLMTSLPNKWIIGASSPSFPAPPAADDTDDMANGKKVTLCCEEVGEDTSPPAAVWLS